MSDPGPAGRIVDRTRGQPDGSGYALLLVALPLVYGAGPVVRWLFGLQFSLAMGGSSLVAVGVLIEVLASIPATS